MVLKIYINTIFFLFLFLATINAKTTNCLSVIELFNNSSPDNLASFTNTCKQNTNNKSNCFIEKNNIFPDNVSTKSGLVFAKELQYRWENNSYTDIIQLIGLNNKAQALQFRILINKAIDDSIILIFQSLEKGSSISDSSWVLDYNIFRGPVNQDGASADEVYALIYNINQNNGLPAGNYDELIKVNYKVIDLPNIKDSVKSSIKIYNTLATTYQGISIDITPSRDEFLVYARVPVVYPEYGIIFQKDTVYQLEDDSYTELMQLKDLNDTLQALQFKLSVNKSLSDSTILTFQNIEKGADISDPSWALDYNVFRGPITANGGSVDEIRVLLYNINQNNGLSPGDYDELLKVKYRVADLPESQDSIKSSIIISEALGSTYQGYPIDITPSRDNLIIIARNRIGLYGDVNGDGCVDVLDLIMVVDHIIGRDSLDIDEFERADIAPWITGNSTPSPDGFVNVLDLALLQEIILSGIYPDGTVISDCNYGSINKSNGNSGSKIKFYIREDGITSYLDSDIDIIAVQISLGNVNGDSKNLCVKTDLGQGYSMQVNELLNVLLYDRQGKKVFHAGENLLADMPFHISQPENITIEKIILIDKNKQKIVDSQVEIIYGAPLSLPFDYKLYQNYPNPFNPKTTIQYSIPNKSQVMLKIYDLLGTELEVLVNQEKLPGKYEISWNADNASSGVYFYRLQAGDFVETKKMILLK